MKTILLGHQKAGKGSGLVPSILGLLVVGATLMLVGCGSDNGITPAATVAGAGTPEASATPQSAPTSMSSSASTVIVGTAVAGSTSVPLRDMPTSTSQNAGVMTPGADGTLVVTESNAGGTAELEVGDKLQMSLSDTYDWTILSGTAGVLMESGGQTTYEAVSAGETSLQVTGDPKCLKATPPCGLASRSFTLNVRVR